jgi:multisite-specific tRNA:(cytosine-C5)-methyltransferase
LAGYVQANVFSEKFQAAVKDQAFGCLIVRFNAGEAAGGKMQLPMLLPVWKAKSSLALMTDKKEKS